MIFFQTLTKGNYIRPYAIFLNVFIAITLSFNLGFSQASPPFECKLITGGNPPSSTLNASCSNTFYSAQEIADFPIGTIWINIHFVGSPSFPGQNFVPVTYNSNGQIDPWQWNNGNTWVQNMLGSANAKLSNLQPSPISDPSDNFLGDSKLRVKLYTDPTNPNDLHGGIWYWDTPADVIYPYGTTSVLNVLVRALNSPVNPHIGGSANLSLDGSPIILDDAYFIANDPNTPFGPASYAGTLIHEFGHKASLCHSYSCDNGCQSIDLDPALECNENGGCLNSCGNAGCDPWNSQSTNMMGYNMANHSLSPCQWHIIMREILDQQPKYVTFCDEPITPMVIASGTNIVWDKVMVINRDVIIEPGAELTVKCKVLMGGMKKIYVSRGSRITLDNGILTNLCQSTRWQGIILEGNNDISHSMVQPSGILQLGHPAIANLIGGEISGAINGVSCNPTSVSWPGLASSWNGVIIANGTQFTNNKRCIEFMLDSKTTINSDLSFNVVAPLNDNISSFSGCKFIGSGPQGSSWEGVTDWASNGITFENCEFTALRGMAIQIWDAGATVKKCTFNNNKFGIHATTTGTLTFPIEIGGDLADKNTFSNNSWGVFATTINKTTIANNTFSLNKVGVYVRGESGYDINNNVFFGGTAGIQNVQSGGGFKQAECDVFTSQSFSIFNQGTNLGFQFSKEEFNNPSSSLDVGLSDYIEPNINYFETGEISNQGSASKSRWNYFTTATTGNPLPKRIVTDGNTNAFRYYYYSTAIERAIPNCDLNSSSPPCSQQNNFITSTGAGNDPGCLVFLLGEPPIISLDNLNSIRNSISSIKQQLQSGPNEALESQLYELNIKKAYIIREITSLWIVSGNYPEAAQLFQDEGDFRKLVGLRLLQSDYVSAKQILDNMPASDISDENYKTTQYINLKRLKATSNFLLSIEDEQTLKSIANGKTNAAPYAQSLLGLLKGEIFEPELPSINNPDSGDRISHRNDNDSSGLTIKPNPADQLVTISLPQSLASEKTTIQVIDVLGKKIFEASGMSDQDVTFNTSSMSSGQYVITVIVDGKISKRAKLFIQH